MKQYAEAPKDPFFNMTWEDYHGLEKPVIKLESLINFKEGQTVMINPDNHGFHYDGFKLTRALRRRLQVASIRENGMVRCFCDEGKVYIYHYQNLIIK